VTIRRVLAPALLAVLFATLLVQLPLAIADRASVYEWFDPIVDVRTLLAERYVEPLDDETLPRVMIEAMIETLDDPYTEYIPEQDTDDFNKRLRGVYAGIGAEVNVRDGYLVIVSPMDDSPALAAGVRAGDRVLEIEGTSTHDLPIESAVQKLTGEEGTPVTILVEHLDGTREPITIVRGRIVTRTVKGVRRVGEAWNYCVDADHDVAFVRVTQFNADTVTELEAALAGLTADGLGGLVLDLRDNPGGGLPTAVAMADLFLEDGVIVSVEPRVGEPETFRATAPGTLPDFPMVVLVNGGSASASEIIAGALQENRRAKILGTRTFGKGSVQDVRPLPYARATLKFTTAYYELPSGRNLHRRPESATWGVDPDPGFVVPVTTEAYIEWFNARRDYEAIRDPEDGAAECVGAAWIREKLRDEPLALAVEAICGVIATGTWPRVSEAESEGVAFGVELKEKAELRAELIDELRRTDREIGRLRAFAQDVELPTLLPADAALAGGTIAVTDANGRPVGTFRIQAGDVELALGTLALTAIKEADAAEGESP
jgi:carboxyl-terminal processing protease